MSKVPANRSVVGTVLCAIGALVIRTVNRRVEDQLDNDDKGPRKNGYRAIGLRELAA